MAGLVAGGGAALAVVLLVAAVLPAAERAAPVRTRPFDRGRLAAVARTYRRGLTAVGVVVAALLVTRVVAVAVAAGVVVWLAPTMLGARRRRVGEQAMLEAVHLWLLQLRTVLAAGSGLEQALIEVATLQPDHSPLAGPSRRMAARFERSGPAVALGQFADEVDNHLADAAVATLVNAFVRQASGVADALDALIPWAEQDVRQRRDIDARLQAIRTQRWMILGIFGGLAGYFTAVNRELMAIYTTGLGQVVLAAILAVGGLCLWGLERMARPARTARFFTSAGEVG